MKGGEGSFTKISSRMVDTGHDLHKCRPTGAIVTQKAQHFATADFQIYTLQSPNTAEALCDFPQLKKAIVFLGFGLSRTIHFGSRRTSG